MRPWQHPLLHEVNPRGSSLGCACLWSQDTVSRPRQGNLIFLCVFRQTTVLVGAKEMMLAFWKSYVMVRPDFRGKSLDFECLLEPGHCFRPRQGDPDGGASSWISVQPPLWVVLRNPWGSDAPPQPLSKGAGSRSSERPRGVPASPSLGCPELRRPAPFERGWGGASDPQGFLSTTHRGGWTEVQELAPRSQPPLCWPARLGKKSK